MTTKQSRITKSLAILSAAWMTVSAVGQEVIYQNQTTYLDRTFAAGNAWFGDEVFFGGTARTITEFAFEVWAENIAADASPAHAQLFLMRRDGPENAEPGSVLFQTDPFLIDPADVAAGNGFVTYTIDQLALDWPDQNLIWTVQFTGLDGNENAGLTLYDPPSVGSSFSDFWRKDATAGAGWQLFSDPDVAVNFGARITAVPEPSTLVYALLGGLTLLGLRRFRS